MKNTFLLIAILSITLTAIAQNIINQLTTLGLSDKDTAYAAYSIRQLSSAYTGPAIKIRKLNSTIDISFVNGVLDTNKIKTYCGTDTCFIDTWYDQSGYNRDVSQSNIKLQPIIYMNNKVVRQNGRPSVYFYFDINQTPTVNNAICLRSSAFSIVDPLYECSYSLVIAGKTSLSNNSPINTMVSMTNKNVPAPFDMYGDRYLFVGDGAYPYWSPRGLLTAQMWNSIKGNLSFNIWGFTGDKSITKDTVASRSYYNGFLNSEVGMPISKSGQSYYMETSGDLIIGSRDDGSSALNGYISEVILFANSYTTLTNFKEINDTLSNVTDSLIKYYSIDRNPGVAHQYDDNFKRNNLDVIDLNGVEVDELVIAYSLRKLSSAYIGPAICIRRASDQAITDVSFDADGKVSLYSKTTMRNSNNEKITLREFAKGTDCFITKWYNQSGDKLLYAYMDTVELQPRIIMAGELEVAPNGLAAIYFNGKANAKGLPYNLRTKSFVAFRPSPGYNKGFDLYVAASMKDKSNGNPLVTKTEYNIPSPFDMYDTTLLFGTNTANANIEHLTMAKGILSRHLDSPQSMGIWQVKGIGLQWKPYYFSRISPFAFYNGKSIIKERFLNERNDFNDAGTPIRLGTRNDYHTSLNGWISEVLIFSDSGNTVRSTKVNQNLMGYYNNINANCLSFSSDLTNYVTIGPSTGIYSAGSSYTKEAWVYHRGDGVGQEHILSSLDQFYTQNNKLYADNRQAIGDNHAGIAQSTISLPRNTWVHVAVVYDKSANSLTIYQNGVKVGFKSSSTLNTSTVSQLELGRKSKSTYYFNGMMDEVRIWNVARTATQIKNNYNKVISSGTGLKAYYNFNQGSSNQNNTSVTTLINNVSPANTTFNGTLNNFKLEGIISNWKKSGAPLIK